MAKKTKAKATGRTARASGNGGASATRNRRGALKAGSRRVAGRSTDRQRSLAMAVLGQFRLIFRSAKIHFQWVRERVGVSGSQLWVLAELQRKPGIRVTELAQAMAVHQSTASNLVESLEKSGLLQRERSSQDQRVVHLSLTDSGRQTVARAPKPIRGVLPDALDTLNQKDLAELKKYLAKLATLMKVRDRAGRRIPLAEM
jgi:DNA-binding MarR family transcriptional regulator